MPDIYLTNSLTRKKEKFVPLHPPQVGMYTCGITAYDYAHIGHGRKYVMDDILKRVLMANGFQVKHVQNVTDVGHLVSDADEGEDKLEKGAKKTGKTVWEVAEFYTKNFYEAMDALNVLPPDIVCKATDNIPEQIAMIQKLLDKGYAYDTPEAVYYDVSKFADYGQLFGQSLAEKKVAVRPEIETGEHKKNASDFALWFKRTGRFADHVMHWESPWGDGFPGWHIECSAMSIKYLGEQFDIHTGGEDHLSIHHPNEIAQSEAATGKKPFVKYWIHHTFLMVENRKMSKSLGNFYTLEDIKAKGYGALVLRYLYLGTHYKKPLNFTWESLSAAQSALGKVCFQLTALKTQGRTTLSKEKNQKVDEFGRRFLAAVNDDLNIPQALAIFWEVFKSNLPGEDKYDLLLSFDEVLGLGLAQVPSTKSQVPKNIQILIQKRDKLRNEGKFVEADKIRGEIEKLGFSVKDSPIK